MRVGQNPAKSIDSVPQPQAVTVAVVSYIPFLSGYYAGSLEVLKTCLESLQTSTTEAHDLLVFDNASCAEVRTYLLAAQAAGLIQYLVLADKNVGKGGAWNFIFQAAPGRVIAYSDSDVLFRPGWLGNSLEILAAYPEAGMVTACPMRTPTAYYTNTLAWAQNTPGITLEEGAYIPWEVYREHVLSLGTEEDQAREWYASRRDWRLTREGVQAYIGAAHFQFCAPKAILQEFLPFQMDRPMGQVRSLDEQMNERGYLRLSATHALVKHLGNQLATDEQTTTAGKIRTRRWVDWAPVRKPLLWVYDRIFRLYHQ